MKTVLALAALVCVVAGEAPFLRKSPSDNPRGVYFVLPPAPQLKQHISPDQVEEIMSQLRQEEGSDSGLYHIVLPDGRLQRVEYTTAPIKQESESDQVFPAEAVPSASAKQQAPAPQLSGPASLLAQSPRPAQVNIAAPAEQRTLLFPQLRLAKVDGNGKLRVISSVPLSEQGNKGQYKQQEDSAPAVPSKYVASVQYTEVQPIQGPIYSYNDQPLTRVLRYAPLY